MTNESYQQPRFIKITTKELSISGFFSILGIIIYKYYRNVTYLICINEIKVLIFNNKYDIIQI